MYPRVNPAGAAPAGSAAARSVKVRSPGARRPRKPRSRGMKSDAAASAPQLREAVDGAGVVSARTSATEASAIALRLRRKARRETGIVVAREDLRQGFSASAKAYRTPIHAPRGVPTARNCSGVGARPNAGPNVRSGPLNALAPRMAKF